MDVVVVDGGSQDDSYHNESDDNMQEKETRSNKRFGRLLRQLETSNGTFVPTATGKGPVIHVSGPTTSFADEERLEGSVTPPELESPRTTDQLNLPQPAMISLREEEPEREKESEREGSGRDERTDEDEKQRRPKKKNRKHGSSRANRAGTARLYAALGNGWQKQKPSVSVSKVAEPKPSKKRLVPPKISLPPKEYDTGYKEKEVAQWSIEDVCAWLTEINMGMYYSLSYFCFRPPPQTILNLGTNFFALLQGTMLIRLEGIISMVCYFSLSLFCFVAHVVT